ncbi:diphosphomevalonate decarboxylase [Patescibacteria group bacterium]|nr:diphosphomevalonate decarboxylase [Patescibacteria group bacterium]MBU1472202.1 diphosphomevalonate decarboxylase [Patescibacteria group bacterium]MBU2459596.1 diphosphomevalonate decarboxylase [Patescibacteria group bacterium]MBU2544163.1 diphosphomevalonate decarboxylase [Patescibacteria group bacterium]
MMKATAVAPANIAFIKYWGRRDAKLRLPYNSSISMNLNACITTTTVEFSPCYHADEFMLLTQNKFIKSSLELKFNELEKERISAHLDRIRDLANIKDMSKVVTINNFPKSSGIASSASGFAALTLAATAAAGLDLSEKDLSILARFGSGSACRSVPDGFVEWLTGDSSETSFAYSLYRASYWDLRDVLVIIGSEPKKIPTSAGMDNVTTSPLWRVRLRALPQRILRIKEALKTKNFVLLGRIIEEDCLEMHRGMQTQDPPLFYWNDKTRKIMEAVYNWRKDGLAVYFTIDAGPNVHIICEGKDEQRVTGLAKTIKGVEAVISNKPAQGTRLTKEHLF